jgi:nanoRNase/pAp phosphatase (c-di-AMP/oligoRNAs hydrolase)
MAELTLHFGGRVAALLVTQEMLASTGGLINETEGLVEYPFLISGVEVSALFKVNGRGQTRVSLRSREGLDIRALARSFGGGGHLQAAAYVDNSPDPRQALSSFLKLMEGYLEGLIDFKAQVPQSLVEEG